MAERVETIEGDPRTPSPAPGLVLAALGVVFGDIATSPLYAVSGVFDEAHGGVAPSQANARGFVSLVVWTVTIIVALKYLLFVLRADNDGEGGVFALYALVHKHRSKKLRTLLAVLILAAGLLFGDGIITPAISVLSAVEGLAVATPAVQGAVLPATIAILVALFSIQFYGTAKVGRVFGPIILLWLVAIAVLGVAQVSHYPRILTALDPRAGVAFVRHGALHTNLLVLGAVILTVTGGEALYADMGHFGRTPIRVGWFAVAYPSLLLNYLGQGAYVATRPSLAPANVFFGMVPPAALLPMVVLATLATVIASQALISGAFSLAAQAVALGLFPRLRIVHTHQTNEGQVYLPLVNWLLCAGCVLLVLWFGSSGALAAAYGLAVSGVMVATSLAMMSVATLEWGWSAIRAALVFGAFAAFDATLLIANSAKFLQGGAVPFAIGWSIFGIMVTWRWGRRATFAAYSRKRTMTVRELVNLKESSPRFLERNAVLMVPKAVHALDSNTPALLELLWERYGVLPKNLIFVDVRHAKVPYVHSDRYRVRVFQPPGPQGCIAAVTVSFGFMEDPDVEQVLAGLASHRAIDLPGDPSLWSVHVSVEKLIAGKKANWIRRARFRLFALLRQISQPAYYYYGLGNDVHLSAEIVPVVLD